MFQYHIKSGRVLLPVEDFSMIKQSSEIVDATTAKLHAEYPDGLIFDCILTIGGADITINRELVLNADGNYELKKD